MNITVSSNIMSVRAELQATAEQSRKAAVRALNNVAKGGMDYAAKDLRRLYPGFKVKDIKARIILMRASNRKPVVQLIFSGKRYVLWGRFGMRPHGPWGVRFRRLPWKVETLDGNDVSAEMIRRAFRQRPRRTGRADVWSRETKARDSMTLLLAPGLNRAVTEKNIDAALKTLFRHRFPIVLRRETRFLTVHGGRGRGRAAVAPVGKRA